MRNYYYLKTPTQEIVYQDEEVVATKTEKEAILARVYSKEEVVETKEDVLAEMETHKLEIYNQKTGTKTTVDAKDSTCLLMWDGASPFYQVIKGISPEVVPFFGWPQVSKENYVEPVQEVIKDVEVVEEKITLPE